MTDIIYNIKTEMGTWAELGIDIEEKAFFDILAHMRDKYQFTVSAQPEPSGQNLTN
ncbi:hypothetical protein SE958_00015 [Escherichia coli]|nr:hypothetical protein [Escherichia coli]MDW9200119.1 hypothetical protein [Escherichia coli]MDW9214619.1 hypothetical protein [Escherichia coli]MDX1833796.1 hypothetical protein [Escherichia coli]